MFGMLVLMTMVFGLLSFTTVGKQGSKLKMVDKELMGDTIHVTAERLWEIVGTGYADVGLWSTAVDHSSGSGEAEFEGATCSSRGCSINAKGLTAISEKIIMFNNETREFKFQVTEGMPGFVQNATNHWQVIQLTDSTSALKMNAHMEIKGFAGKLMGKAFEKNTENLLNTIDNDLKIYAETGNVSESKKRRMAKVESKSKHS